MKSVNDTLVGTKAVLATQRLVAARPKYFFRSDGQQPEVVSLPIRRPRGFANQTQDEWNALVTDRVRAAETDHRERRRATGKRVLGRDAVLAQNPFACPNSSEPHFDMSPRIAAKSKWPRIEAIGRNRAFLEKYRSAIKAWLAGVVDVVFPSGTYWMRKFARVLCEATDAMQEALASPNAGPAPVCSRDRDQGAAGVRRDGPSIFTVWHWWRKRLSSASTRGLLPRKLYQSS